MKKLTRNQKIYIAVLGVALMALLFDQVLLSPSSAGASESATFHPSASPVARAKATASRIPDLIAAVQRPQSTLASRFIEVTQEESLDVEQIEDAMRAPASWFPVGQEMSVTPVVDPDADKIADEFLATHQLNAVMANAQGGYAIVDGKSLRVGQELKGGFVLIEVRKRSIVLKRGGTVVELALPEVE